jgi:hypothetical protein
LWPTTREQETSVSHVDDEARGFTNFCPEVSFDRFGYFASYLHHYADEMDLDIAHRRLAQSGAPPNHWAWAWSTVTATHYTECPVYSVLIGGGEHDLIRLSGGQEANVTLWDQYGRKIVIGVIAAVATAGILALIRVIF